MVSGTVQNVAVEIDKFESKILALENEIDELEQKLEQIRGAKELLVSLLKNAGLYAPALVYKSARDIHVSDETSTDRKTFGDTHTVTNVASSNTKMSYSKTQEINTHNDGIFATHRQNSDSQEIANRHVNDEPRQERILPPDFYAKTISVVNTGNHNQLETIPESEEDVETFERKRSAFIRNRISHNPMKEMQEMENKRKEEIKTRNIHNKGNIHSHDEQKEFPRNTDNGQKHPPSELSSMVL